MFNHISSQASKLLALTQKKNINSKTKIVAITSGKGGVGKSTLTFNISYLLKQRNFKVAVLDADIGLANLQVLFDTKPQATIYEYIDGKVSINEILHKTKYGVDLIAGKSGYEYTTNKSLVFERLIRDLLSLNYYDVLLIDTGAGLNDYVQEFLYIADEIIAITTTDPSALTDVYALMKMVSKYKDKLMLCFNHTLKYETGNTISKSLVNLATKNKLNGKFMVQYIGNVCSSDSISSTGRLRKLFVKEFEDEFATIQMTSLVDNLIAQLR